MIKCIKGRVEVRVTVREGLMKVCTLYAQLSYQSVCKNVLDRYESSGGLSRLCPYL